MYYNYNDDNIEMVLELDLDVYWVLANLDSRLSLSVIDIISNQPDLGLVDQ